jgi:hypothetical protein
LKNKVRQVSLVIPSSEIERIYKEGLGDVLIQCEVRHSRIEITAKTKDQDVELRSEDVA